MLATSSCHFRKSGKLPLINEFCHLYRGNEIFWENVEPAASWALGGWVFGMISALFGIWPSVSSYQWAWSVDVLPCPRLELVRRLRWWVAGPVESSLSPR
ncbi:hypothetical protein P692DRAFT_20596998 [Suillus brevipes Sb2]|nr:hypothetical protein P692DRAFT_20596998 [Suillus brevipes Sb2]